MPSFRVVIETREGYEKIVEAPSEEEARMIVEEDDRWGSPDAGWERNDDCYSAIDRIEKVDA